MSLTEPVIGSQLQPAWLMISDWSPETYIVLCVEMAHGCSDLIYSGTYVSIFFPFLSCFSPLCSCLYLLALCFSFISVASITCSLFISLFCWRSLILCLMADSLWCFDLSYGTDKGTVCVYVCASLYPYAHTHTHLCHVFPLALMLCCGLSLFGQQIQ